MASLHNLTALEVRRAKGPRKLSDGGGLVLNVRESGSKSWTFIYRFGGRRPEIGLGSWPDVTLSDARATASRHAPCDPSLWPILYTWAMRA